MMRRIAHWGVFSLRCTRSLSSTASPAPPLLAKIKGDLKTAMKAKDTNRLNVLRALIADTTNASKASPLSTDLQVLALLRKRSALSKSASADFAAANRNDLKEKEDAQIAVLDEYASHVKTIGKDEIQRAILESIEKLRSEGKPTSLGDIMKTVSGTGGPLHGKPVEKGEIAMLIK